MARGIYAIYHDDRCAYVGCSVDIRRRQNQHRDTLRRQTHCNFLLQRAWNKDAEGLSFVTLEIVPEPNPLDVIEQAYIDTLKPWANISDARGSHPHTAETREKMRKPKSAEHRKNMSELRRGKPSPRKGIPTGFVPRSAFPKGVVPWNKNTKGAMVSWSKGKKFTDAHRLALRMAKLGKKQSPETLAKRKATMAQTRLRKEQMAA